MSDYLPRCCYAYRDESGAWVVQHDETMLCCHHVPSGGTGGKPDGVTPCCRRIGLGDTKAEAVQNARDYLEMN